MNSVNDNQVSVALTGPGYASQINVGNHTLYADEPEAVGGENKGPTPYGYLLSALGACTTITIKMYADRKGWPLESVYVNLTHDRNYFEDCASCESGQIKLEHIRKTVELSGALSPEQVQRLEQISSKCPVHKTLTQEVRISTEIKHV